MQNIVPKVGNVVEWLKHWTRDQRWTRDQHQRVVKTLDTRPTRSRFKTHLRHLLCPWESHFTAHFPAWWSWQAVLNYNHISIKLQADSNILASPEAGRGNCLPYVLAPPSISCELGGKYRDKIKKIIK